MNKRDTDRLLTKIDKISSKHAEVTQKLGNSIKKLQEQVEKSKKESEEKIIEYCNKHNIKENPEVLRILYSENSDKIKFELLEKHMEHRKFEKLKNMFYNQVDRSSEMLDSLELYETLYSGIDLDNIKIINSDIKTKQGKRGKKYYKNKDNVKKDTEIERKNLKLLNYIQEKILFFSIVNDSKNVYDIMKNYTINAKTKVRDLDTVEGYFYLTPELKIKIRVLERNYKKLQEFRHPYNVIFNRNEKLIKSYIQYKDTSIQFDTLDYKTYTNIMNNTYITTDLDNKNYRNLDKIFEQDYHMYSKKINTYGEYIMPDGKYFKGIDYIQEEIQEEVQENVETVQEEVQENVETVQEEVQENVETVQEEVQENVETVQEEVQENVQENIEDTNSDQETVHSDQETEKRQVIQIEDLPFEILGKKITETSNIYRQKLGKEKNQEKRKHMTIILESINVLVNDALDGVHIEDQDESKKMYDETYKKYTNFIKCNM
jgi:hypothetical protein